LAVTSWLCWAAAVLSLWLQHRLGVYHTRVWLWLPPAVLGLAAAVGALLLGCRLGLIGPGRWAGLAWACLGASPLLLWAALVVYMFHEQAERYLPNDDAHKVGRMAAVNLLEGHAWLLYPRRIETDRLVMYYGDGVGDPAGDAAAMDAHLARLEGVLRRWQREKITLVRGPSLGLHGMSIHSVALGSDGGVVSWVDRHESAHSFLYQFSRPESQPPMLLLEGWAMALDGHPEPLRMTALACRSDAKTCLARILAPSAYHRGTADAYYVDPLTMPHGVGPRLPTGCLRRQPTPSQDANGLPRTRLSDLPQPSFCACWTVCGWPTTSLARPQEEAGSSVAFSWLTLRARALASSSAMKAAALGEFLLKSSAGRGCVSSPPIT